MSYIDEYNEFFHVTWYDNPVLRQNQNYKIVNNRIILHEIPDEFQKVIITGKFELNKNASFPTVSPELYYKVNYNTGEVTFHQSLSGTTITIASFYARGNISYFAKKVILQDENNNWNSATLEDLANEVKQEILNLYSITDGLRGYGN